MREVRHARGPSHPCPLALPRPSRLRTPSPARRYRIAAGRPHLGDDLGLLTSELLTNAIRHGACGEDGDLVELVLWPADGHYWLAVSDPGTGKPVPAHPGPDCQNGRGLLLVEPRHRLDRPAPPHARNVRDRGALVPPGRLTHGKWSAGRGRRAGRVRPRRRRCSPPGGSFARPPGAHSG
ncbi:ATP-binding protein [Streptomyces sp. NPDC039022]|uniref:ATP-binding protein n=1 Tax=Streptomyces sp. NPDC039022 TaxID=3157091 RepID=UPI0033FBA584